MRGYCPACFDRGRIFKGQRAGIPVYVDCGVCWPREKARAVVTARRASVGRAKLLRGEALERFESAGNSASQRRPGSLG